MELIRILGVSFRWYDQLIYFDGSKTKPRIPVSDLDMDADGRSGGELLHRFFKQP
jgi:hypothetical protein